MRWIPKVDISIDLTHFIFSSNRTPPFSVETYVYILKSTEELKVVSIGSCEGLEPGVFKVSLFEEVDSTYSGVDKYKILVAFLCFGINKCFTHTKLPVFRPIIRFHGINNFSTLFHGYEKTIFYHAAVDSAVSQVLFE